MSNFLTIATVTATLQRTLQDALVKDGQESTVTTIRPDGDAARSHQPGANISLYQVTPNAAWRNNDLPTRNSRGDLVQRPRAALDLHYLISCYGDDGQLQPQRLLGTIVRRLHEWPVLTREMIRKTMTDRDALLSRSNLFEEVESVKLTPSALSLEELSKLWSVFFQAPYALSAAYQASIVFIDGEEMPTTPLPVREPKIYVTPFHQPVIESIESSQGTLAPVFFDSSFIIKGKKLVGDITLLRISGQDELLEPEEMANDEVRLEVPPGLAAGVHTVQVVQQIKMGSPAVGHQGAESNVAIFVLHPKITSVIGKARGGMILTVTFRPKVQRGQRVLLFLNELTEHEERARAYSFRAPRDNGITKPKQVDTSEVDFTITSVLKGKYLVRVQVDGAESQLTSDKDGNYISPTITIK